MTDFCQRCSVTIVSFCLLLLLVPSPMVAAEPEAKVSFENAPVQELLKQNKELQRQVNRLKQQVVAQREELNRPGATEIVAGIGYIVGVFGLLSWRAARKKQLAGVA